VFERGIPDKGRVLTGLSDFWFDHLPAASPHHRITSDVDAILSAEPALETHRDALDGRSMLCVRARPIPVECVVRGYLAGSGWREYRECGAVTGCAQGESKEKVVERQPLYPWPTRPQRPPERPR
jgi:phosphoribosylaminoimidazole-succinocarboxamide synthase